MDCARFSFRPINVRHLAGLLHTAGAEQTLRVLSLQVAGHCCQGAWVNQMTQVRARRRLKNSHRYCYGVTGLFFGVYWNERVFPLRGTSWDAFIGDQKHAEKFAADISLAESAANNSRCRKRSVCCDRPAKARQTANRSR